MGGEAPQETQPMGDKDANDMMKNLMDEFTGFMK